MKADITTISIRKKTRERLEKLRELSEKEYYHWDHFFNDLIDVIAKKFKLDI